MSISVPHTSREVPHIPHRAALQPLTLARERTLPVPHALAALLPDGLVRGTTLTINGDCPRAFAFALGATASQAGAWIALIGLPGVGWRALNELGTAPHRVVTINPTHTSRTPDIIAAAIDGFDLVMIGSAVKLASNVERRLAARARERGALLIGIHDPEPLRPVRSPQPPFEQIADLRANTSAGPWEGLTQGSGQLIRRPVTIELEGKKLPGRRRSTRLLLPNQIGQVVQEATASTVGHVPGRVPSRVAGSASSKRPDRRSA